MIIPPNVLTIAGSDSGGGAGIQADLKCITALGAFGASVITALTAQNGAGVSGIYAPPADFAALQLTTVLKGFKFSAAKMGMLCNAQIIKAVVQILKEKDFPLVVDPVCVSQSGHHLLEESAVETLKQELLPLADLLTPNRPEAELLAGMAINTPEDIAQAARILQGFGAKAVLIKGGHFDALALGLNEMPLSALASTSGNTSGNIPGEMLAGREYFIDWLCLPELNSVLPSPIPLATPKVATFNNHGTGCTLSAAIATYLALGEELLPAIKKAQIYLHKCLAASFAPGIGAGPPNFMAGAGL